MTKKWFAWLLALAMLLSTTAVLAEPDNLVDYATLSLTYADLQSDTDAANEYSNYLTSPISGYYTYNFTSGDASYSVRRYIPEDCILNPAVAIILIPSNTDPYDFIVETGWKAAADEYKFAIGILLPQSENGVWGTFEEESAYISRGTSNASSSGKILNGSKYGYYLIGYGDAADLAMQQAMTSAATYAGAAFIGSTGVSVELTEKMAATASSEAGVSMAEVPCPAFIVANEETEAVERLISYYKNANDTVDVSAELTLGSLSFSRYYAPDEMAYVGQPDSEPVCGVYFAKGSYEDYLNADATVSLWKQLNTVRKYPGYANNAVRGYYDVYAEDSGFKRYTALDTLGKLIDGGEYLDWGSFKSSGLFNREWFVFTPDSVVEAQKADPDAKFPVIFVFHGRGGSGYEIAGRLGWDVTAEKYGAILVMPSSTLMLSNGSFNSWWWEYSSANTPNDILFFDEIYAWLLNDSEYASMIDASRIYATGQSHGGRLTCNLMAYRPECFAAVAPSSWADYYTTNNIIVQKANMDVDIPVIYMLGQDDRYFPDGFSQTPDQLVVSRSAPVLNTGSELFEILKERYDLNGPDWSEFTFQVDDAICTVKDGNLNQYIYTTDAGYPMFAALEVAGLTHATIPSECELAWNLLFSHYSRDPGTKVLYYDGQVVDTPVNMALYEATK